MMESTVVGFVLARALAVWSGDAMAQAAATPIDLQRRGVPPVSLDRRSSLISQDETIGAQPRSFVPIVGNFSIGAEGDNSLAACMHVKYGQPCDELLQNAPKRFLI